MFLKRKCVQASTTRLPVVTAIHTIVQPPNISSNYLVKMQRAKGNGEMSFGWWKKMRSHLTLYLVVYTKSFEAHEVWATSLQKIDIKNQCSQDKVDQLLVLTNSLSIWDLKFFYSLICMRKSHIDPLSTSVTVHWRLTAEGMKLEMLASEWQIVRSAQKIIVFLSEPFDKKRNYCAKRLILV